MHFFIYMDMYNDIQFWKWDSWYPDKIFPPVLTLIQEKHREEVMVLSREAGSLATGKPVPVCFCSSSAKQW